MSNPVHASGLGGLMLRILKRDGTRIVKKAGNRQTPFHSVAASCRITNSLSLDEGERFSTPGYSAAGSTARTLSRRQLLASCAMATASLASLAANGAEPDPKAPPHSPASKEPPAAHKAQTWEFENELGSDWMLEADAKTLPEAVVAKDGQVRIATRAKTWDRVKITTVDRQFGPGTYTWRVRVPAMGKGDMASVGAFIYRDDQHEMDFEIGPGKAEVRRELKTADDELICYCTNQAFPSSSSMFPVKADAWHTLALELLPSQDGNLLASWSIDGRKVKELATKIPATTRFGIHCSVENLKFLGDHQPFKNHEAIFDRVAFTPAP